MFSRPRTECASVEQTIRLHRDALLDREREHPLEVERVLGPPADVRGAVPSSLWGFNPVVNRR
jgi:hypothetical protein